MTRLTMKLTIDLFHWVGLILLILMALGLPHSLA